MEREPSFNREREESQSDEMVETTQVGGKLYEIDKLRNLAENLPVQEVPLDSVRDAVGEGHIYWIDRNEEQLGPSQIIQDWEAAQGNEAWADHVDSIKRANLDNPIWMTRDGHVFDGVHRLSRAVIENQPTIKVKIFDDLPEAAVKKD